MLDTSDYIILTLFCAVATYFFFKCRSPPSGRTSPGQSANSSSSTTPARQAIDRSFLGRMKAEDRQVLILFGSQTGTAEELAGRLAKDLVRYGKKALVMDPEEIDVEDFPKITEVKNPLLILCMATYGEGDPTDNAQAFHEYLSNNDCELNGLRYAVFGLGNKTYEHYNAIGKFFDKKLEELGAERVVTLGLGDDDANLEEDFMRWRENFLPALANSFQWELVNNGRLERQYRLEIVEEAGENVYTGEYGRVGAYDRQKAPFDHRNPYLSTIAENRELHTSDERSCRHIEFNIDSSLVRYDTGDHIGIFAQNKPAMVERIGQMLNVDLSTVIKLINLDEESSKRHPFPCPCSYRIALTHYVDICAPVKSHVLKALSEYTGDEKQREKLVLLSTANDEGLKEYGLFIQKERRNIADVLEHFDSCRPPLDLLLEMLPRLQARYYSISSSPKADGGRVSVTALVTTYEIGKRTIDGVCTTYLASKAIGDGIPVFIRKSTMRLPHRMMTPVIMIGPGTGFAPFRGFLQERLWHKQQGKDIGEMVLYYGCRRSDADYIYCEELKEYVAIGLLTKMFIAFSRQSTEKVYVQHKMWESRDLLWGLIQKGAHIFVCGDARNMARDVQNMFLKIFRETGGLGETTSQKLMKDLERQRRYLADVWS